MRDENALLTQTQRKFLQYSEEERQERYSKQQRSYHRQQIRERVKGGIKDFTMLWDHWDEEELRALLADPRLRPSGGFDDEELYAGMRDTIAVALYLSGGETLIKDSRYYHPDGMAGQLFLEAFKRWGKRSSYFIDSVDIEVNGGYISWPTILAQLEQGEDVDPEKLMLALQVEQVGADLERIQELLQEEVRNQLGMASGEGEERDGE